MKKVVIVAALVLALAGCTDATVAKIKAFGQAAHVTCYSGGKVIYDGDSSGQVSNEEHSDGWYWMDKSTGKLVRVTGQCVVRN